MMTYSATALAHPNIAFIKYWGNRDSALRLPTNGSISMNLAGLHSKTSVSFSADLAADSLTLNGSLTSGAALERVTRFIDLFRQKSEKNLHAQVISANNFPTGAGIASSASAFAALAVAADKALGLNLSQRELSHLARRGSGSACRSIPAGFVEWRMGTGDADSFAETIASPEHWELIDLVAVVRLAHKTTGSSEGHQLAETSPLNSARVAGAPDRLSVCRQAILDRDFDTFARVVELDSTLMHAVMMTSTPPLFYWEPATVRLLKLVMEWRKEGLPICATVDAGPNVHVICLGSAADEVSSRLANLTCVNQILRAAPGGAARIL